MGQTQQFFTSDKLSSNRVLAICQDKTGYIWVGTEYGLNKYDGYRFTSYLHEASKPFSISSNIISFLFSDDDDNLWVGTQMGLDRYNRSNDQFEHVKLEGAKALPRINDMIQEDEDHLLIGTAGYGLYRLNIKTLKSEKLEGYAQIDKDYYSHIFLDSEGAFWKSGHGSSIDRRVANGKIQSF
jgi:ligand-binding sensor domain-containing protein